MPTSRAKRPPGLARAEGDDFAGAVLDGLSRHQKSLPCRFFYDAEGSALFEEITRLPEYYPTRTETAILEAHAAEMAQAVPAGGILVEFGSGSSTKTEILLRQLPHVKAYVCVDVSESALLAARDRLAERFPALDVRPIIGDFSRPVCFPADLADQRKTGFFPGSTIGNLAPTEAVRLLGTFRSGLMPEGHLIVGVDLMKSARKLVLAYNDAQGVTAAFNLNLLARINRELAGTFDLAAFEHEAVYNPREGRIEMYLKSTCRQVVTVHGRRFSFKFGERIHTENSYKYGIDQFHTLARSAGWRPGRVWTDRGGLFSVHELVGP
ncbi:MAG: L-histidine N(alpha)-methyltransferase [Hyphomicrobiaceae bacterium]|nr:L-histidine N(alpha)-methyltransferase [Hyphomicrobiaceae bacterium]